MNILVFEILVFLLSACSTVLARSPTNSYAPHTVSCPIDKETYVREANGLSAKETSWLKKRISHSQLHLLDFFKYSTNLNSSEYESLIHPTSQNLTDSIKIGLGFSGGGFRAMLCGAGELSALDNRTTGAFQHGLGGLLQSSTYLAGISGGNWLVGTLALNNWSSVEEIMYSKEFWQIQRPLYEVSSDNGNNKHYKFSTYLAWKKWVYSVWQKHNAGFKVSVVDIWGRALATRFLLTSHKQRNAQTWSDITTVPAFANAKMPFPISVADGKFNQYDITVENSTIFESNPFEFGTWDNTGRAFTEMEYLGTNYSNKRPVNENQCIKGFDNAAFIMASSSNIFDLGYESVKDSVESVKIIYALVKKMIQKIDTSYWSGAIYSPNPFYQSKLGQLEEFSNNKEFALVDGGQDWQNMPMIPLMVPERQVDLVFAFDNSADTGNLWPNASALQYTYNRQFMPIGKTFSFPYIPPSETFVSKKLNKKPVFFGCDAKNLTSLSSVPPLVIYNANREYNYMANTTTMQMAYSEKDKLGMIKNGFAVATRNNLTDVLNQWSSGNSDDLPDYRTCIGCAILRRKQERLGIEQSEQCQKCFEEYCWNGEV